MFHVSDQQHMPRAGPFNSRQVLLDQHSVPSVDRLQPFLFPLFDQAAAARFFRNSCYGPPAGRAWIADSVSFHDPPRESKSTIQELRQPETSVTTASARGPRCQVDLQDGSASTNCIPVKARSETCCIKVQQTPSTQYRQ